MGKIGRVDVLRAPPGTRAALLGNEAIARGVIESGISVVTGYPGTPSSEVIMTLHAYRAHELGIYVEWAVNERVAFEIAYGASIGGARSMVTMKAPGANVAADPIVSAAYGGVEGGLVIYIADDPGPHTTQTEQDTRWFARMAGLPAISPVDPDEARKFVRVAIGLSDALKLPIILRATTRVSHTVGDVVFDEAVEPVRYRGFRKDVKRFVRAGMSWNRERHAWLLGQLRRAEELAVEKGLVSSEGSGDYCVVCEGVACGHLREALKSLGEDAADEIKVVRLGIVHPIPREWVKRELSGCRKVLVLEELSPYLEVSLKALLHGTGVEVVGMEEGLIPSVGEMNPAHVAAALNSLLGRPGGSVETEAPDKAPPRPPPLCPGCPHRNSFIALRFGLAKAGYSPLKVPVFGDIGCYALGVSPPLEAIWTEHSMGASISMAAGLKIGGFEGPVVAVIGDSTFYHAGLQSLIEAVHKRVNLLVMILDNDIIAMTGHQSTPAWARTETGREARPVRIEEVVKAIGVEHVYVVDPYDIDRAIEVVKEAVRKPGVKVVIMKHPCALWEARVKGVKAVYRVVPEKCTSCMACVRVTGCPALYVAEDGKVRIMEEDCTGCGLCARYCPYGAIIRVERG